MISLTVGQELSPQDLARDLVYDGYEYNLMADQPGVYAHRGAVIDVWIPSAPHITRLTFGPITIEAIVEVDEKGQVVKTRDNINIISGIVAKKKKLPDFSFLIDLKPGDYIVHIDHGIGKFVGLLSIPSLNNKYPTPALPYLREKDAAATPLNIRGGEGEILPQRREYFIIAYAENDKLYVPVESADRIDKYLGGVNPHLHRLSGAGWYQLTQKIKTDVEKTARELLALYASRAVALTTPISPYPQDETELADTFPFDETPDQFQAIEETLNDLTQPKPMDRLVCGDVGFGKTEVAIRTAYRMTLNGYQVAMLAPTTILAQQHFDNFVKRFEPFNVSVDMLSRFRTKEQQQATIKKIVDGQVDIVIGTHRILSQDIKFKNLGLIVIDEEQKFGVKHKEALKKLRTDIHVLALSATPIPRTLHFSLSGLRDISVITTPPHGRLAVKTYVHPYQDEQVIEAVKREVARGGQVYYLYNRVETMPTRIKQLRGLLPDIRIEMAHGQMTEKQLVETMHRFDVGEIDLLVCSTIIENGLDLPNVNTLIVEDSTKFGLAQLYQLRGRIGRSHRQAYAYFMYHRLHTNDSRIKNKSLTNNKYPTPPSLRLREGDVPPLTIRGGEGEILSSQAILSEKEIKRLEALEEASELGSGFQLAVRDMEIRGVGNILGQAQHGNMRAIGLSFYSRLLAQAVEEIKTGRKTPLISEVTIDLPLAYGLPPSLEPNEQKRMALYQRLANVNDLKELEREKVIYTSQSVIAEESDKTAPGQKVLAHDDQTLIATFFSILELKILGRAVGATSIIVSTQKDIINIPQQKLTLTFRDHSYAKHLEKLLKKYPHWKVGDKQIKINLQDFGPDWLQQLKYSLQILKDDWSE